MTGAVLHEPAEGVQITVHTCIQVSLFKGLLDESHPKNRVEQEEWLKAQHHVSISVSLDVGLPCLWMYHRMLWAAF